MNGTREHRAAGIDGPVTAEHLHAPAEAPERR
jgi:hypothetical protein